MGNVITLTTDFGLTDGYVAAVKGVILGINPEAKLVDISHSIGPQDIAQAAFVLATAYSYFPSRTVHLVVVDPGVGSERRAIILRTSQYDFVAPDNGVLSYVLPQNPAGSKLAVLAPEMEAVAITKPEFWRSPVSSTFHGRDIFAPVAARLALGLSPATFGKPVNALTVLPLSQPRRRSDGSLTGHIQHVDSFGNLITDIRGDDLPGETLAIEVSGRQINGLSRTYTNGHNLLALIGSSGYLEIAVKEGSARDLLNAGVGDEVKVMFKKNGSQ
ncbi:MAG: SAM-dependent chlorinase/fluorinase [Chloroflexi bacterium]|nr:SAM-dependent chlorinase/fluorinase [Chloroflexota bacterium]